MLNPDEPKRPDQANLARRVLRERGLNDQEIDALLKRLKASENLN